MYRAHINPLVSAPEEPGGQPLIHHFCAIEGRLGDPVDAKCWRGADIGEVLPKVLCHNMCVPTGATRELGIEPTLGAGSGFALGSFILENFLGFLV
jgi:hypothetical protein